MRNLTWLTLLALATACNGEDTNDTDTDSGDSDTEPTIVLSLDSGTTSYEVLVDAVTVCDSAYSITGDEYENGYCDNCDFMFSVAATQTANTDTTACPNRNPWRYTLSTPYPAAYPDDRAGIGYVSELWYVEGYGEQPVEKLFLTFYHYAENIYGTPTFMSGTLYPGEATEEALPGTFSDTDGNIAWTYNPEAVFSPSGAYIRNCTDRADIAGGDYLGAQATIPTAGAGDVITGSDTPATVTGGVDCEAGDNGGYVDVWSVTAGTGDLKITVDTTDSAHPMDAYVWVNDSDGCTVALADDSFNCTSGQCSDGDTAVEEEYDCCPSVTIPAPGAGNYSVYVMGHPTAGVSCTDAGHIGNYSLKVVGATATPTLSDDDDHPSYEINAAGTGVYTETEE